MAKSFRCRLVTPSASLVNDEVTYASLPAWDGLMGVLPGRAPMLAQLGIGELSIQYADQTGSKGGARSFFVDGGFVQMNGQTLTILAERAVPAEQLNAAEVQAELRSLESRVVPEGAANRRAQLEAIDRDKQRARAKLRIAAAGKPI